ncbi:MAG: HAD family hydrolase [Desulfobacterota bacterium]|nr:HAD family hydrolase [Thermodesulfobacteriota bacterium]
MMAMKEDFEVISFDLDGTLVDSTYVNLVWEKGIPELYALKNNLSLEEATKKIIAEYEKVGDGSLKWYDIKYWFEFLELPGNWNNLLQKYRNKVRLFPEVREVIEVLSKKFQLIVTSNAAREFVEIEIKETGIGHYFSWVFSATSDFGQLKKTPQFYQQVCEIIRVNPLQVVHIGDHYEFDFLAPQKLGIKAYYLDRNGNKPENGFTIKNLKKLIQLLNP